MFAREKGELEGIMNGSIVPPEGSEICEHRTLQENLALLVNLAALSVNPIRIIPHIPVKRSGQVGDHFCRLSLYEKLHSKTLGAPAMQEGSQTKSCTYLSRYTEVHSVLIYRYNDINALLFSLNRIIPQL
jgi:hypothetical protein